jgi:hypothetical protein
MESISDFLKGTWFRIYAFLAESRIRLSMLSEMITGTIETESCAFVHTGRKRKTGRRYLKNTFISVANLTFYPLGFH